MEVFNPEMWENKIKKYWLGLFNIWFSICSPKKKDDYRFVSSYLVYSQIWLTLPRDDDHFFYIFLWMIILWLLNKKSWKKYCWGLTWPSDFFGGEFSLFRQKYFERRILFHKFPVFWKTIEQKSPKPQLPTIWFFHFHILSRYCQLWLNIFMDDCHLSNVTKLKKNHCPDQAGFGLSWRLACTSCTGKQPLSRQKDALTTDIPLRAEWKCRSACTVTQLTKSALLLRQFWRTKGIGGWGNKLAVRGRK